MGMFIMVMFPPVDSTLILFTESPRPQPASALTLIKYLPYLKGGVVSLPPSILEELWELGDEAISQVASHIWMVVFAGAALRKETGDGLVKKGVPLVAAYGS